MKKPSLFALPMLSMALFMTACVSDSSSDTGDSTSSYAECNGFPSKYLCERAYQGEARAQVNMGTVYYQGEEGVAKSYTEAAKWIRKAAEQGLDTAQNNLGMMYELGHGVPQSNAEAASWYRKAAEQGYTDSQNSLASMYYQGRGVAQSDAEAVKWFSKSAKKNNAEALYHLGMMYGKGRGVEKSYIESLRMIRHAGSLGHAGAKRALSKINE